VSLLAKMIARLARARSPYELAHVADDPDGPMLVWTCSDPSVLRRLAEHATARLTIEPGDTETRLQRAVCLHCLGDIRSARRDLTIVARSGNQPYAEEAQAMLRGNGPRSPGYGGSPEDDIGCG